MTKQEAIKILNKYDLNFCDIDGNPIPPQDLAEAFRMAIEALEQEQQRQEDIYECQHCLGEVHKNYIYCPFCGKRIEALQQEPIIHCKDCKYWHEWENGTGSCHRSSIMWVGTNYDNYCSLAKGR